MARRLTQADSLCPPAKYPNLDHPFDVCTGSSRRPTGTDFRYLRKPELSPEDLKTIEEIRENDEGLAPEVVDSLVRGFVKSKLGGVSPGPDTYACAVGSEKSGVEPEPAPGPGPGEKKAEAKTAAEVIRFPRYPRPPKEVMGFCKENYREGEWRRIIRGLHKWCLYRQRREDKYYPGKSERKNSQYVWGQVWLADKLGISRKTVEKWVQRFEADGVIYYPYKGYIGRGASIVELTYTERHRRMNKRKTGERKNPLSIR